MVLKHVIEENKERWADEEEDISSYRITLRKREDTKN
jgi:hypothetical protein